MKRLLAGGIVAILLMMASPAQAAPEYGYRYTARNGWIVWADNDRPYFIRTVCRWRANGTAWVARWRIPPGQMFWTTSDEGNWGDRRPRNLRCSYVRL